MIRYVIVNGGAADGMKAMLKTGDSYPMFKSWTKASNFKGQLESLAGLDTKDLYIQKIRVTALADD